MEIFLAPCRHKRRALNSKVRSHEKQRRRIAALFFILNSDSYLLTLTSSTLLPNPYEPPPTQACLCAHMCARRSSRVELELDSVAGSRFCMNRSRRGSQPWLDRARRFAVRLRCMFASSLAPPASTRGSLRRAEG